MSADVKESFRLPAWFLGRSFDGSIDRGGKVAIRTALVNGQGANSI